jgi:ABC-type polysaccharide/polyol phosphate export permease
LALAVTAIGALLLFLGLFADSLGIGSQPGVMGWKQSAGISLGGVLLLLGGGLVLSRQVRRGPPPSDAKGVVQAQQAGGALPSYDTAAPRVPFLHELLELYRYRFLLWNLVSRDLKVRYKRSVLGFFWAMVNPLLTMAVLLVVFTRLFRFQIEHYPIYILSGLLLWALFSRGTSLAMQSVLSNSSIRKKIYVPASVFVAASVGSALVNLLFALAPLLLLALIMGVRPTIAWLYLPVPILQTAILAFGVGLIIAAVAVFFADMVDIYEVALSALFYLTPIIYPVSILPLGLMEVERFNLAFRFIEGFRGAMIYGELPSLEVFLITTAGGILLTVAGWSLFTRLSDQFSYRT